MAINSKNKGNTAERELCKILGEAFGGSFIRSANSGAFIGGKNIYRKASLSESQIRNAKSDIVPPDEMSRFVIECKHYNDFQYHALLQGPVLVLDNWINQQLEVVDQDDFWMVAFKTNRRPWVAVISAEHSGNIKADNRLYYKTANGTKCLVTGLSELLERNVEAIKLLTKSS